MNFTLPVCLKIVLTPAKYVVKHKKGYCIGVFLVVSLFILIFKIMNTKKETSTARLVLGTNAKNEILFLLIDGQPNQITKETEKAICYRGYGRWLSSTERMLDMWIPKSIMKIEDRKLNRAEGGTITSKCLIVPAWFYNKFLHEKNLIDFN